jgi:hypothetical protein
MERLLPFIASAPGATSATEYTRLGPDADAPLLEDGGPRDAGDDDSSGWDTSDTAATDEVSPIMSSTAPAPAKRHSEHVSASRLHEPHWRRLTRRYRLAEFAISLVMMGGALVFALIDVHERTLRALPVLAVTPRGCLPD